MNPPAFKVDRFWLERLAMGVGRDERLDGMQRHFVRVVDGKAKAIGAEEKAALAEYLRLKAGLGPEGPATGDREAQSCSAAAIDKLNKQGDEGAQAAAAQKPSATGIADGVATYQRPADFQESDTRHEAKGTTAEPMWSRAQGGLKNGARSVGDTMDVVVSARLGVHEAVDQAVQKTGAVVRDGSLSLARSARDVRAMVGRAGNSARVVLDQTAARYTSEGRGAAASLTKIVGKTLTGVLEVAGKTTAGLTELTAIAVAGAGAKTAAHSDTIGAAMSGAVSGVAGMMGGAADSMGVSDADIRQAGQQLNVARMAYECKRKAYVAELTRQYPDKRSRLLEQVTIGGLLLSELLASQHVPDDIAAAYAAAYPVESLSMDFRDKVDSFSSGDQLEGVVSAVKGKLFEMKYLEELNAGGLPEGWHAELATSATQPGWDLRLFDEHGAVQNVISAKATEHVAYVKDALERYPDIDVVTTSEVYAAMAGLPEGARLIDGGLNHVDLHGSTHEAAAGQAGGLDASLMSALALGPAAYAHFVKSNKPVSERASGFTDQVARAKTASVVGNAAMLAVPFWPVAFLAAVGLSMAASVGNNKREQLRRLEALRDQVREAAKTQHEKLVVLKTRPRLSCR